MNLKEKRILVTGGNGFLGKTIVKKLLDRGVSKKNLFIPSSLEYDLRVNKNISRLFKEFNPHVVIHLAANVGGIEYNASNPATIFYDNLIMGLQLIEQSRIFGVEKFVAIGTVCAYPKLTKTPFKEKDLWEGYPEENNAPYGLAKKMLLVQLKTYEKQYGFKGIYLLPTNLYGPGDNFDSKSSHVIPALIKKFHNAIEAKEKEIKIWGSGKVSREFLYVDDAAEAIIKATERYDKTDPMNIGTGNEITIKKLVNLISKLMNFKGEIVWDLNRPEGQPRRRLDISRARKEIKFKPKTPLEVGLAKTIDWYNKRLG